MVNPLFSVTTFISADLRCSNSQLAATPVRNAHAEASANTMDGKDLQPRVGCSIAHVMALRVLVDVNDGGARRGINDGWTLKKSNARNAHHPDFCENIRTDATRIILPNATPTLDNRTNPHSSSQQQQKSCNLTSPPTAVK